MRLLYDHRHRLGTLSGRLDDMPLTIATTLLGAALLFGMEAVIPSLFGSPLPSNSWLTSIPHLGRIAYCIPVLAAIYTTPPRASEKWKDHQGRLFVPLLLDARMCAGSWIVSEYRSIVTRPARASGPHPPGTPCPTFFTFRSPAGAAIHSEEGRHVIIVAHDSRKRVLH